MPTVLRNGPYRFFFYSSDRREPAHVHVERDGDAAKFWLEPVRLQGSAGFSAIEIRQVERLILQHRSDLLGAWHAYFRS